MLHSTAILKVDLGALRGNYRTLAGAVGKAATGAVVKANGYGLGAVAVARALLAEGCRSFFTACIDEALELKASLPEMRKARIYVFGGVDAQSAPEFISASVVPVINNSAQMEVWSAAAVLAGSRLPAAVHVDTGMNRLGFSPVEFAGLMQKWPDCLSLEMVMSHLACADVPDHMLNTMQLVAFREAALHVPKRALLSLANSAGVFLGRDYHFSLVRPGIGLYGANPVPYLDNPMRNVASLFGKIIQVRELEEECTIGYGATVTVQKGIRIATVSIGYADGVPWSLSNNFTGYVDNFSVPLLGRVTMDLCVFDVTGVPEKALRVNHYVEIFGAQNKIDALATQLKVIPYEILTRIGNRVQREYWG